MATVWGKAMARLLTCFSAMVRCRVEDESVRSAAASAKLPRLAISHAAVTLRAACATRE
jgi:hypothetical protein